MSGRLKGLDYEVNRFNKIATFHLFAALQGSLLSTVLLKCYELGIFDVVVQAAVLTAATVASVSAIVAASPSYNFMWLGGILSTGMGLLIGANLINLIWRTSTVLHLGIAYLGAGLFALMLLYDTSKVVKEAQQGREGGVMGGWGGAAGARRAFDPINHALELYLDMVNLFYYLLRILIQQKMEEQRRSRSSEGGGGGGERQELRGFLGGSPSARPSGVPPLRPSGQYGGTPFGLR